VKVEDQMEKYQKLNESTSNERERYTKQLSSHTTEKLQFQENFSILSSLILRTMSGLKKGFLALISSFCIGIQK